MLDTAHSDIATATLIEAYFASKSAHDAAGAVAFFAPDAVTYTDAPLGWAIDGFAGIRSAFEQTMPHWGAGRSYPTAILGALDEASGSLLVRFTNTPGIVGNHRLHLTAAVDVRDGRFLRWIDYWDTGDLDTAFREQARAPVSAFPTDFREAQLGATEQGTVGDVAAELQAALGAGEVTRAASLFDEDAVLTDLALRTSIVGRSAIERYLARTSGRLPYAAGSRLRHVLGRDRAGGYEWHGAPGTAVHAGITTLILHGGGLIEDATTVYDSVELDPVTRDALIAAATSPWR